MCTIKYAAVLITFTLLQDPHFKASTHRRRIISTAQLADYAYLLAPGGVLYTITDVPELGAWMREKVLTASSIWPCMDCSASSPLQTMDSFIRDIEDAELLPFWCVPG